VFYTEEYEQGRKTCNHSFETWLGPAGRPGAGTGPG